MLHLHNNCLYMKQIRLAGVLTNNYYLMIFKKEKIYNA